MAWQHRNTQTAQSTSAVSSLAVNKPTGAAVGDLLVIQMTTHNQTRTPSCSGFTSIHAAGGVGMSMWAGYRIADGTEGSTFTVSISGGTSRPTVACSAFYDDAAGTITFDTGNVQDTASGTSHASPSVTPAGADELAIANYGIGNPSALNAWTPPSGYAEVADVHDAGGTCGSTGVAWKSASSGSQSITATSSQSLAGRAGLAFFITTPAAGGTVRMLASLGVGT